MPLLMYEAHLRGFRPRGLAHPGHWGGPLGPLFQRFGAVKASPLAAYNLLKANQQVLLFPGGAREVNKKTSEANTLLWPEDRADFIRMAARTGAIIVPFAAVGADEAYDVMFESEELLQAPVIGDALKAVFGSLGLDPAEAALPLTRLPGTPLPAVVPLPDLSRLYFKFLPPVDTKALGLSDIKGRGDAGGVWREAYAGVRASVVGGMEELLAVQARDPQRSVQARMSRGLGALLPALNIADGGSIVGDGGGVGGGGGRDGGVAAGAGSSSTTSKNSSLQQ